MQCCCINVIKQDSFRCLSFLWDSTVHQFPAGSSTESSCAVECAHVRRIIFPPTFYTVRSISQRVARYQYHVITTNQSNRSLGSRLRRTNIDHIPYPINDTGSHISYVIAYRPNYGTRWWFVTVTLRPICHLLLIAIDDGCRHCKFGADTHDYIIGIIDRIADIIVLVRNRISKITEQSIEFDLVIHSSCDDV